MQANYNNSSPKQRTMLFVFAGLYLALFACGLTTGFENGSTEGSGGDGEIFPTGSDAPAAVPTDNKVETGDAVEKPAEDTGHTPVTDNMIAACSFFQNGSLANDSEYLKFYKPGNVKQNPESAGIFNEIYSLIPAPFHDDSVSKLSNGRFRYDKRFFEFDAKLGSSMSHNVAWVYPYVPITGDKGNIEYIYQGRVTICDAPKTCKLELRLVKRESTSFEALPAASVSRMCN